jgi:hypothetical protein
MMNALVKHIVGESENSSKDLCESFSTGFTTDSTLELERPEVRREFVF